MSRSTPYWIQPVFQIPTKLPLVFKSDFFKKLIDSTTSQKSLINTDLLKIPPQHNILSNGIYQPLIYQIFPDFQVIDIEIA